MKLPTLGLRVESPVGTSLEVGPILDEQHMKVTTPVLLSLLKDRYVIVQLVPSSIDCVTTGKDICPKTVKL